MPKPAIVFALYKPHAGKDAELLKLVQRHYPALRKYELVTDRVPIVSRSANGTIIEVFEWVDGESHKQAHEHPEIAEIWELMAQNGGMPTLGSLPEAVHTFPHFEPVSF
jgi:quinol monooxygenase YgiN